MKLLIFPFITSLGVLVLSNWPVVVSFSVTEPVLRNVKRASTELCSVSRRNVLGSAFGGAAMAGGATRSNAAVTSPATQPLADLPMVRIKLPQNGLGREYVAIKLKVKGKGPFDFMIDSGLTTELITPHLQQTLGISTGRNRRSGLAAGGGTDNYVVTLDDVSLCCGSFASNSYELPLPKLTAIITDFPQGHIDPDHDPIEGMLGMELLSLFDVDFDFPNNRIRFWPPGTANKRGLVEIPAVVINETGLIGIRLTVPGAKQPILAFLDCGASFSCMNWKAADFLGLPPKNDAYYRKTAAVSAVGVDGNMINLPLVQQALTFAGEVEQDRASGRPIGFAAPPPEWKSWDPVRLAVGDIPAFSTILGDGRTPFNGPAALVGLDVLAQRRVILEAGTDRSRRRRVFVSPR